MKENDLNELVNQMEDAIDAVINSKESDVILCSSLPALIRKKGWRKGDKIKLIIIKVD